MEKIKSTIFLINPGHEGKSAVQHSVPHRIHRDIPPISILTLGSYLEKFGENIVLLDTHLDDNFMESINRIIKNNDILLVGITTFVGKFICNAQKITEYIKSRYPRIPIVWGGPLTSTLPGACLTEGKADYIVFFNGEEPLRLLIEALRDKSEKDNIPNIGFLKNGVPFFTKQENNPFIYSDVLDWKLFGDFINVRQIPYLAYLFTSRGCPYGCRFCYHQMGAVKHLRKCLFRTAGSVIKEVEYLNKNFDINVFTIGDDNFFSNKKRAIEILAGIREMGCYIEQAVGTFNDFNDEVILNLKGICQTIICSIETTSESLLELINKPINLNSIPKINQKLTQAGINTIHSFMFGLPGETDEDRRAAVELMVQLKKINPYVRAVPYFFTPLPGTPMIEDVENMYGNFPKTLSFWSDCEIIGLEDSYKFRPWLEKEEQIFITEFITIFKELFQSISLPLNKEQLNRINSSIRLKHIFSCADNVNCPKDKKPKYLLDAILSERNK